MCVCHHLNLGSEYEENKTTVAIIFEIRREGRTEGKIVLLKKRYDEEESRMVVGLER